MTSLEETTAWSNVERAFMQALFANRVMTEQTAQELVHKFCSIEETHEQHADLAYVMNLVEKEVKNIGMEIKYRRDQVTRKRVIVLANTTVNDFTKIQTTLVGSDVELFRTMLEAIFGEMTNLPVNKFYIDKAEFIDEIKGGRGFNVAVQQVTALIDDGWIQEDEESGKLYATHRTFAELDEYLQQQYGPGGLDTLKSCAFCKAVCTQGVQCKTEDCPTRLHQLCQERYFDENQSHDCLNCRVSLDENHYEMGV